MDKQVDVIHTICKFRLLGFDLKSIYLTVLKQGRFKPCLGPLYLLCDGGVYAEARVHEY